MIDDDINLALFYFEITSTSDYAGLSHSLHRNYSKLNWHHLQRQAHEIAIISPQ